MGWSSYNDSGAYIIVPQRAEFPTCQLENKDPVLNLNSSLPTFFFPSRSHSAKCDCSVTDSLKYLNLSITDTHHK